MNSSSVRKELVVKPVQLLLLKLTLLLVILLLCQPLSQAADPLNNMLHVDQFGQDRTTDWVGKAKSAEDIKRFEREELEDLKQFSANDPGLKVAEKDPPTSYFSLNEADGKWWFRDPHGQPFYSLGIDCIAAGAFSPIREQSPKKNASPSKSPGKIAASVIAKYDWLPEPQSEFALARDGNSVSFYRANLQRKWGQSWRKEFEARAISRIRNWKFNSFGNWSDEAFHSQCFLPYFGMGPSTWELQIQYIDGDIPDVYDPMFDGEALRVCNKDFEKTKSDKWLVGYFLDNELPWWNIPYDVLALDSKAHCRSAWIEKLKTKYGSIDKLNNAWSSRAKSFEELRWVGEKANSVAQKDMNELLSDFAERFYSGWYKAMKQADPNHLVLGSRIPYPMDVIVDACAQNTDVLSFNHYGIDLPKEFDNYYRKYHKPILIGEYNFDSLDAGLHKAAVRVRDQTQRGIGYRFYTEQAAAKPYMIGTHYFQYIDEPLTGRSDGESSYNGFVSVVDRPYPELVKAARITNARVRDIHSGKIRPFNRTPAR